MKKRPSCFVFNQLVSFLLPENLIFVPFGQWIKKNRQNGDLTFLNRLLFGRIPSVFMIPVSLTVIDKRKLSLFL